MRRWRIDASASKRWIGRVLLAAWIVAMAIGLDALSARHMAAMPEPDDEAKLSRALLALRTDPARDFLVHVIYAECSCTQSLFSHLIRRGAFVDAEEIILFAGEDDARRHAAQQAGFRFVTVPAARLAQRYGLEAAPILAVFTPQGRLQYIGGYFDHPAAILPLDERIRAQARMGATPAPLPVFGCAVSRRLQKEVDPLGIVYRRQ